MASLHWQIYHQLSLLHLLLRLQRQASERLVMVMAQGRQIHFIERLPCVEPLFWGAVYATNIELGNTQIKRNDLADPQTTAEHLNCHDDTWKTAFDILTVIALALNSLELAGFYFFYLLLTSDFLSSPTTSLIIDAIVLAAVLVFSFTRLDVWLFFTMPDLVCNYFSGKEHWESWCELFSPFKRFIYNGMLIILALPLAVRVWFKLVDRQKVKKLAPTG